MTAVSLTIVELDPSKSYRFIPMELEWYLYLCLSKTKALISLNGCKLKSMIVAGKCQMYVVPVICLFVLKSILFHYTAQLCITRGWPCKLPFPNSLLNWDTLIGYLMVIRGKISGYFLLLFSSLAVAASFMVPAPTRQALPCGPSFAWQPPH